MTYSLNYLTQEELHQTVSKIQFVKRPLGLSLSILKIKEDDYTVVKFMKKFISDPFAHHYAIIVNTKKNGQYILEQTSKGFVSNKITNKEREMECYSLIEQYESSQLISQFTVKDLQKQDPQKYSVFSNNCIHYVNVVKQKINKVLKNFKDQTENFSQTNLTLIIQGLTRDFYKCVNDDKPLTISEMVKKYIKIPSYYYEVLFQTLKSSKHQNKLQMLMNCILIAISMVIKFYLHNCISIAGVIFEIFQIISRDDLSQFQKIVKCLYVTFQIFFEYQVEGFQLLKSLFSLGSNLIDDLQILQNRQEENVNIDGFTVKGYIGGLVKAGAVGGAVGGVVGVGVGVAAGIVGAVKGARVVAGIVETELVSTEIKETALKGTTTAAINYFCGENKLCVQTADCAIKALEQLGQINTHDLGTNTISTLSNLNKKICETSSGPFSIVKNLWSKGIEKIGISGLFGYLRFPKIQNQIPSCIKLAVNYSGKLLTSVTSYLKNPAILGNIIKWGGTGVIIGAAVGIVIYLCSR